MRSKTTIEIYAYWDELRGHRDVPTRSQIEPAHIRNILADLFILEKTPHGDIRFRLAGTRVCALFARELRGYDIRCALALPNKPAALRGSPTTS